MSLIVELPPDLEKELSSEAGRGGVTPADQATLMLYLAGALLGEGPDTPFRVAVRSFLARHRIDPGELTSAFDQLKDLCLEADPVPDLAHEGTSDEDHFGSLLRGWRDGAVHRPIGEQAEVSILNPPVPTSDRPRPSILGKYAYLGLSSDDYIREKREERDREERKLWP